jgi:hypothetical protein
VKKRPLESGALKGVPVDVAGLPAPDGPLTETARAAIAACITQSCGVSLAEALVIQARVAAEFLNSAACREGRVGMEYQRIIVV